MGNWFSNISIRSNGYITMDDVARYLSGLASDRQYSPVSSAQEADGGFAIFRASGAGWFTVCSDLISLEDPGVFTELAAPMSAALRTDVLGISCYDSDYLWLNLVNAAEKTDAWIGIGSAAGLGIRRRSGLNAWKKKVEDFSRFSELAKENYICAEEFLGRAAACLGLPVQQGCACYEYLGEPEPEKPVQYLYFKLPENEKNREPTRLVPHMYSGMPCFLGKPACVDGVNVGGPSRGLSVYFLGPYVEHDEITFSDVCFVKSKPNSSESIPFELEKIQLPDGQWAYHYHDPGFRIPPRVKEGLPPMKQLRANCENSIIVRFVPHGDPRKILDITVALVPDKHPEGQTGWNVWHRWGSKAAFIAHFNERESHWAWAPEACLPILREEDFD